MSDPGAANPVEALHAAGALMAELSKVRDVPETLQAVTDGVRTVGFTAAALNLVRPDVDLEVSAVTGPDALREALAASPVQSRASWERVLAHGDQFGGLVLTDARTLAEQAPDLPTWYPDDELLAPLRDRDGSLLGVLSVGQPVDGLRPDPARCALLELYATHAAVAIENARLRVRLDAERERFLRTFEVAPIGMAVVTLAADGSGTIVRLNAALCDILGRPESELLGAQPRDYLHPEDRNAQDAARVSGERREVYAARVRVQRPDGAVRWCSVAAVNDLAEGTQAYRLVYVTDITDSKAREEVLEYAALHDPLTGLLNRRALGEALIGTSPVHGGTALLYVDLDDFKAVNDTHGHETGDQVLVEVARRLTATARLADVVARIGGDEFVVVARGLDEVSAQRLARRLAEAVGRPMDEVVTGLQVSCSVGIAVGGPGSDATELLRRADRNLLDAKESRREGRGYARGRPNAR